MSIFKKLFKKEPSEEDKRKAQLEHERKMLENQSQKTIDKTVNDSFPASDPPGNY